MHSGSTALRENSDSYGASPVTLADVMLKVLLMVFVMYMVLTVIAKKKEEGNIRRDAEFQIIAQWNKAHDPAVDSDVDLWVRNPDDQIVYWRSKENALMNIERDDIGSRNDKLTDASGNVVLNPEDAEHWYLRAIVPGEYTVNLHLYSCGDGHDNFISSSYQLQKPLPVEVRLTKLNPKSKLETVQTVLMTEVWQEKTAFNFTLSAGGNVTNITQIPVRLINASAAGVQ